MEISNKVALITGGASGLGLSTAKTLVESGANVMLLDLNEDNAKAAVEELGDIDIGILSGNNLGSFRNTGRTISKANPSPVSGAG